MPNIVCMKNTTTPTQATLRNAYFAPAYSDDEPTIDYPAATRVTVLSEDRRTDSHNLRLNVRFPNGREMNLPAYIFTNIR